MADRALLPPHAVSAAIAAGALEMHYQPVVALPTLHVVGFEALARLREPDGTLVPPEAFVPVVERGGRVVELGRAVLRRSISEAARWRAGSDPISTATVSINVAPAQLEQRGFVDRVQELLAEYGVPGSAVVLEITETSVTSPRVRPVLERLAGIGVRVALDDFGVGFATLDNLRRLPVQVLKLDRSFVAGVTRAGADRAIVKVVVDLADNLGLSVIAEGVETEEQADALLSLGCPAAQGFLFAHPDRDPVAAAERVRSRHTGRDAVQAVEEDEDWPQDLDAALLAAARLLTRGADPHRSAVHAVATAIARRTGAGARVQRTAGRLALVHDLARVGLDGALPPALADDHRLAALVGLPGPVPPEVAVVRAAVRVADDASAIDPLVGRDALAAALAGVAGAASGPLAAPLAALVTEPPDVVPVAEVVDDLERRRVGRRGTGDRLRALVGVTRVLSTWEDGRELTRVALEEVRRVVGAASASLERWERDIAALRTLVNVGTLAPGEVTFPDDELYYLADWTQARRTMLTGLPYIHTIDTPDADPEAIELLKSLHKYSSAALPVYLDGRMWGQVWLATEAGDPPFTAGDLETLMSVATLLGGVVAQADRLDRVRASAQDPLTRVGSRTAAEAVLERLGAAAADVTLLVVDVDRLKLINDAEGHVRGDEVLVELADALSAELVRHPGGSVARLGPDEFGAVLPGCTPEAAAATVERVRQRLLAAPGSPTISVGLAPSPPGTWRAAGLLAAAVADLATRSAARAALPPAPARPADPRRLRRA